MIARLLTSRIKTVMRRAALPVVAVVVASSGAQAPAQVEPRGGAELGLNIDINTLAGGGAGVPSDAYGAAAGQPGRWHGYLANGAGNVGLVNLTGAPSGVSLLQLPGSGGFATSCPPGAPQDFSRLMCDYRQAVAGVVNPIEYQFDGLAPGTYMVYTYGGRAEPSVATFQIQLWLDNTFIGQDNIGGTVASPVFQVGVTHTVRSVTLDGGETLRVIARDFSGEFGDTVSISGFQIVRVGEPLAAITAPGMLECTCAPVTITGTATASDFAGYVVEYSTTGSDPWTLIGAGASPVANGTLATWNNPPAEGYFIIRLTVLSSTGVASTAVTVVYVNLAFDPVVLHTPVQGQILGGHVCFDGTVWDSCGSTYTVEFRALPFGVFAPIEPGMPVYPGQVINLPLSGGWETDSGPTAVPDGNYQVRVRGSNACGNDDEVRSIVIDNTPPIAVIRSPINCSAVDGVVSIVGTASDAHMSGWFVQYTGGDTNQWVTIAQGTTNVVNGVLAEWDTSRLPPCCYAIRLVVTDAAALNCGPWAHQSEFVVLVDVGGCPADFNGDQLVNSTDFFDFLAAFFMGCP